MGLAVGALITVGVIIYFVFKKDSFINNFLKKNNSLFATGIISIVLFFILLVLLIFSVYQICDLITGNDIIKNLVCTVLPIFVTFVSTLFFFMGESDRGDAQERRAVMPYFYIESFDKDSSKFTIKNGGLGSACNIICNKETSFQTDKYLVEKGCSSGFTNMKLLKDGNCFLIFEDIYGNKYKQIILFENDTPKLEKPKLVDKKEEKKEKKKKKKKKKKQKSDKK